VDLELLVEQGEVIGYALIGVLALLGFTVIHLLRRRGDLKRARMAVHLASLSINEPRPGPIAVTGSYHEATTQRWLECNGQRVAIDGGIDVVRGTRARWRDGARTYTVGTGDTVIAIGVMSKVGGGSWRLVASPGESGVQLFAAKPRAAPPPLFPWRAPLFLVLCGGIAFGALYGTGSALVDVGPGPCTDTARLRLQIAAALPLAHDAALDRLARCR